MSQCIECEIQHGMIIGFCPCRCHSPVGKIIHSLYTQKFSRSEIKN